MAPAPGGRARDVVSHGSVLDNGAAHLHRRVRRDAAPAADASASTRRRPSQRLPLTLVDAEGHGLRMRARRAAAPRSSAPSSAGAAGRGASGSRCLRVAARWRRAGFRCAPGETVADLTAALAGRRAARLHRAALRRRAQHADERSERRGLPARPARRARPAAPGAPTCCCRAAGLGDVFPAPALAWLAAPARRSASRIASSGSSARPARLARRRRAVPTASSSPRARSRRRAWSRPHAAAWAATRGGACATSRSRPSTRAARAARLPEPMLALHARRRAAGAVRLRPRPARRRSRAARLRHQRRVGLGRARHRGDRGSDAGAGGRASSARHLRAPLEVVRTVVEKRATFACTPALVRPPMAVAPGLFAAATTSTGPYPATLEGAVRSGVAAARAATRRSGENSAMRTG